MKIYVVLVRSEYSSNIGAAARAVANMGADRLILIDPRCDLGSEMRQMAAGAQSSLKNLIVYPNWADFYAHEGEGLRIAMTRRGGRNRKVFALEDKVPELKTIDVQNLYLIFGPEADGLDADDLAFTNFACHLPIFGDFASMNLAQAVLLSLYIVRREFKPEHTPKQTTGEDELPVQPLYFPDELIKDWLTAMGFDIQARRSSAYLTLRRLFLANQPTKHELQVLESILHQNIRKLKEGRSVGLTFEKLADDLGNVTGEQI